MPKVGTIDKGTWRRILLIPFNATIEDAQDKKNYADTLFKKAGGAILQWIVDGAKRIIAKEFKLEKPQIVEDAMNAYRQENDWLQIFLDECCEIGKEYSVQSSTLHEAYKAHCQSAGETPHNQTEFYKAIENAGFTKKKVGGKCKKIFGLKLLSSC